MSKAPGNKGWGVADGSDNEIMLQIRDGETGNLFIAGDVDDLAKTILHVLENRAAWPRQIAAGRKFVEQERSWKNSVARYVPVYEKLVTRHAFSGLKPETTPA